MNFKHRKSGAALILDCAGVGNGIAVMPLKKLVDDAIAAGDAHLLIHLGGVTHIDAVFCRGLYSALTAALRAEGGLWITGLHAGIKDGIAKYGAGLPVAADEAAGLKALFPGVQVVSGDTPAAVLGTDQFLSAAFHGISHFKERITFHYFSNPAADLVTLKNLQPRIVFVYAAMGLTGIKTIKQVCSHGPTPPVLIGVGTPRDQLMLRQMMLTEGYDDQLQIPFTSEEQVLKGLDLAGFRKLLATKLDLLLSGWYDEERSRKSRLVAS